MSPAKDRGLGDFGLPERRRERSAAALRSATSAAREPDPPPAQEPPAPSPVAAAAAPASAVRDAPMPPPRRRREPRVQLNTRVRQDLHDRLQAFIDQHDAAVQDVVETALVEYLDRRTS